MALVIKLRIQIKMIVQTMTLNTVVNDALYTRFVVNIFVLIYEIY